MLQEPSNEQKLTYIYETLKEQESRRRRHIFYKFLKWIIIIGFIYLTATNPSVIVDPIINFMKPIIAEQVQSLMDEKKKNIVDTVKSLIPE